MAYEEASLDATTSARVDISCGRLLWDAYPCSVSRPTSRIARIMSGPRMLSKNVSLWPEFSLRVGYSSHVDLEYKSSWGRVYLYCLKRQEILKRRWMRSEGEQADARCGCFSYEARTNFERVWRVRSAISRRPVLVFKRGCLSSVKLWRLFLPVHRRWWRVRLAEVSSFDTRNMA